MCRETIRRAVVQKFNEAKEWKLESFEQLYNEIKDVKEANAIINSLKICDPAVGSGHFLVSALNEIIAIKSELNILSDRSGKVLRGYSVEVINDELIISIDHSEFFEYKPGNKESQRVQEALFHEKQTIIENCLFGVDINPNSVKICRLRLWIELLKNAYYTADSKYAELETLPNIDINIKQGNSLISRFALDADLSKALKSIKYSIDDYRSFVNNYKNATDKEEKRGFEKLINQIKTDFRTEIGKNDPLLLKKNKLGGELYNLLNQASVFEPNEKEKKERNKRKETLEVAINKLSTEIEEIKSNTIYKDAFEWRFEFPEVLDNNGNFIGFDSVIGNPPYISLQRMKGQSKIFEDGLYSTYTKLGDIYCLFFEKGIQLLRDNGYLTYVTSNSWMRTQYGKPLRHFFLHKTNPQLLLNIEDTQLFDEATVESNILTTQKAIWRKQLVACSLKSDFSIFSPVENYVLENAFIVKDLSDEGWTIGSDLEAELKHKFENGSVLIKDMNYSIYYGLKTGFNDSFYITTEQKNELLKANPQSEFLIKPAIRGRDIFKYGYRWNDVWMILIKMGWTNANKGASEGEAFFKKTHPSIYKHLKETGKNTKGKGKGLFERDDQGDYWWELRPCDYYEEFEKEKIVWGELSDEQKFSLDNKKLYSNNTIFFIRGSNLRYLLAILNSRAAKWYFNEISTSSGMGTNRWLKYKIEQLPIKDIPEGKQRPFVELVDEILKAKKKNTDSNTAALENEIDKLVYQLYGLTENEIKIVEGK
jgi:type II restriction/modification system DNA methylase subunit YeeA